MKNVKRLNISRTCWTTGKNRWGRRCLWNMVSFYVSL